MYSRIKLAVRFGIAGATAALAGCTMTYTEPVLSGEHPASATAAPAPLPERSRTLDLAQTEPVAKSPTMSGTHHGHATGAPTPSGDAAKHERESPSPSAQPVERVTYTCPMHPEVVSGEPARCPKCGMKLVPKKDGGDHR